MRPVSQQGHRKHRVCAASLPVVSGQSDTVPQTGSGDWAIPSLDPTTLKKQQSLTTNADMEQPLLSQFNAKEKGHSLSQERGSRCCHLYQIALVGNFLNYKWSVSENNAHRCVPVPATIHRSALGEMKLTMKLF